MQSVKILLALRQILETAMKRLIQTIAVVCICAVFLAACSPKPQPKQEDSKGLIFGIALNGPLVSSRTTMATAWVVPKNPLEDKTLDNSKLSTEIKLGFKLFTDTPHEAPQFAPSQMSCSNCHLNAGQREKALPLVGVAGMFPEYNRRSGRLYSLTDRIVDCFLRSENATGELQDDMPTTGSPEVLALSAYLTWIARGYE